MSFQTGLAMAGLAGFTPRSLPGPSMYVTLDLAIPYMYNIVLTKYLSIDV